MKTELIPASTARLLSIMTDPVPDEVITSINKLVNRFASEGGTKVEITNIVKDLTPRQLADLQKYLAECGYTWTGDRSMNPRRFITW